MERQVSLRLPAKLLREIDRRAKRRKRSRAEIIRTAVTAYLELPEGALDDRPIERVGDLLGSVGKLPRDLATRADKYLASLGRR